MVKAILLTNAVVCSEKGMIMSEKHQKLLRLADVRARVPYSRSTIYQLITEGRFPKPISLGGRAVAWLESEIDAWITARVESARG